MNFFSKIFILILFITIPNVNIVHAQLQDDDIWFRTSHIAIKYKLYNTWSDWSDWENCEVDIRMDLSNDRIIIYSLEPQIYKVIQNVDSPYDNNGEQIAFKVIDQNNNIGRLRLRLENNSNTQIYIDFNDVSWVYNIKRIK